MKTPGEIMAEYEPKELKPSSRVESLIKYIEDYLISVYCNKNQVIKITIYDDIQKFYYLSTNYTKKEKLELIDIMRQSGWKVRGVDLNYSFWGLRMCSNVAPWWVRMKV